MIFYVFPSSLNLFMKAQGGAGGGSQKTTPSPAPLSQGEVVDDASRVAWSSRSFQSGGGGQPARQCPDPRGGFTHGNSFRLMAIPPASIGEPHGDITKVEVIARVYRSNNGGDDWCGRGTGFPSPPGIEINVSAFIAPWYDIGNKDPQGDGGMSKSDYGLPDTHKYVEFPRDWFSGYRMIIQDPPTGRENHHNFALSPTVNPATPKEIVWDITAKRPSWTDAELVAARWGLAAQTNDQGASGGIWWMSGVPQGANNNATVPRWNVSQLALRVTADAPPGGDSFVFLDE